MNKLKLSTCLFPGYKWCGPFCSGPGAPVNKTDTCCMWHDICLQHGYDRCYCDLEFMKCLQQQLSGRSLESRQAALMYHFIKVRTALRCRK